VTHWKTWLIRSRGWLLAGLAVSALLVMREASALLRQLQSSGAQAHDMGTFSGPRVSFWDVRPLADAMLLVPLQGVNAPKTAMSTSVWEQQAVQRFSGAPPGRDDSVCSSAAALCRRVFRIAPDVRPQVSAPLGWTLSKTSRNNLDEQLTKQFEAAPTPAVGSLRGYDYRALMHTLLESK
jgi:hypothetical protein